MTAISTPASSADNIPIPDGVYMQSTALCDVFLRGEADLIDLSVENEGRTILFAESSCVVRQVEPITPTRSNVLLDCRQIDTVYQDHFFLDQISPSQIALEGQIHHMCEGPGSVGLPMVPNPTVPHRSTSNVDVLIDRWFAAEEECRGSSTPGNACEEREMFRSQLNARGLCYGKENQSRSAFDWHPYTASSINGE